MGKTNKQLEAEITAAQEENANLRASIDTLEEELEKSPNDTAVAEIVNSLKAELDALGSENVELRTRLEKATSTVATAPGADATTNARFAVLEEELEKSRDDNADLSLQVAKMSKVTAVATSAKALNLDPVKVGKHFYKFAIPAVFWKGKRITADDVRESDDLIADLIAAGSGMLVKQ